MTFFYDLNKKLADISAKPETKQLNERDEGKHNNATTGFKALADKAAKEYGSKAAGERVAGAVRNKMKKAGKLEENDMEESAFQAAIGKKKYGADGMKALQKAGREHASDKTMSNIRNKYDKYDESMEEGLGDMMQTAGAKLKGLKANITKNPADRQAAIDAHKGIMKKEYEKMRAAYPNSRMPLSGPGPSKRFDDAEHSIAKHKIGLDNNMEEGMLDSLKNVGKKIAGGINRAVGHGSDEAMRADLQKKMGLPPTGKKPVGEEYGPMEGGAPMTPKQKKFAKLAPPADKITFADKIAGAKKEVDEMLGDVAADAIKKAITHKGGEVSKKGSVTKHRAAPGVYGGSDPEVDALDKLRGPGKDRIRKIADEGSDWKDLGKEYSKPRVGTVTHGAKHDIEQTATGQRVTRRVDPNTGHSVGAEDDKPADGEKRGRGRPKKTDRAPERVTAKAYKHKGGRKVAEEGQGEHSDELKAAMAMLKKAGYKVTKDGEQELDEKAVSKAQQRFMGMVHATQKGEKAPSKEVAKVAKTMKKKDAEDFAATKHKGLPEKKKPEGKKKEKTEEAGGTSTPTASSGFSFGKGIYDSMNRELENMIAESMSINMSDSTEGGKSLTITATDDDAMKLAEIVRNAGLGGEGHAEPHGEVEVVGIESPISGDEGACDTCGSHDCGCGDVEEALAENEPDWPTDEVQSDDALQYSGGLNGPKSTGQTTVPVIANQGDRTGVDDEYLRRLREAAGIAEQEQVMAPESIEEAKEMCDVCEATPCKCDESVEESIARFRSLAGIQETKKVEEDDVEEGNKFTGNLAKARAAGAKEADLDGDGDMEKVRESVSKMTNLWKAYKG